MICGAVGYYLDSLRELAKAVKAKIAIADKKVVEAERELCKAKARPSKAE